MSLFLMLRLSLMGARLFVEVAPMEVENTARRSKKRRAAGEKTTDKAWTVSYDPILPLYVCINDADLAKKIVSESRNPADVKLAKEWSMEEVADELALALYRISIAACDVRRRAIQSTHKAKEYDELKAS